MLERIRSLIEKGEVRISDHGYDELANDGISAREAVSGTAGATLLESYPDYPKGPCILVLAQNTSGQPIHIVWGIPRGKPGPAVLVTAYRPDPEIWENGFTRRRT